MSIHRAFAANSPNRVFLSILLGALAGLCYALLIPTIMTALSVQPVYKGPATNVATVFGIEVANFKFAAFFVLLCLGILAARSTSQMMLLAVSIKFTSHLRRDLYQRITKASMETIDAIGGPKLVAALTEDVRRIVMGARLFPDIIVVSVTLMGMLAYLLYSSVDVFLYVLAAIFIGALSYQVPVQVANRRLRRSRAIFDDLQEAIRALIQGQKELKLDRAKREEFSERVLLVHERDLQKSDERAYRVLVVGNNYGDMLSFFVIGAVAFVYINYHAIDKVALLGVVMVLLYITSPIAFLLNAVPELSMARISLEKIEQIRNDLKEEAGCEGDQRIDQWQVQRLVNVTYSHRFGGARAFQVGPIDLEIRRGEVLFIVGGNGSGKSTLSKLISLHYARTGGDIWFDDHAVSSLSIAGAREEIGAIYSDYFLFDRLLGGSVHKEQEAALLLKELELDGKVRIEDGKFSTLALSDGQRRRLALMVALLEDKNLYLFDEWAADQDPVFKEIFYRRILPDLRRRGKAVVVISHDDRYFDSADRVVTMENGKITSERTVHAPEADAQVSVVSVAIAESADALTPRPACA